MLKAVVSYSKKIPVEGREFSSQGYSLSLETEIPDTEPAAIEARLHATYELVRASVERELANGQTSPPAEPQRGTSQGAAGRGGGDKASNKQLKFITDLATRQGLNLSDLNAMLRERFGVEGLYDLSRREASIVLDEMHGKRKAA